MNMIQSVCEFMEKSKSVSEHETNKHTEENKSEIKQDNPLGSEEQSNPRDGMSAESAKFLIGRCASNTGYKVYGLENRGRYFTAKVLDQKGKMVSELLVDKLNGNVKFIR
jgi:hypothetical protein